MKCVSDIYGPQTMNWNDFGDPLTYPLTPSWSNSQFVQVQVQVQVYLSVKSMSGGAGTCWWQSVGEVLGLPVSPDELQC